MAKSMSNEEALSKLKSVAIEAGKIMANANLSKLKVEQKSSFRDQVTDFDVKIQEFCIKQILQFVPDAKFFAEEEGQVADLMSDNLFVIDPIDGTTNFIHNYNISAVSIAWLKKGKAFAGVVYNPFSNEMYSALKGKGAYLNGKKLQVTSESLQNTIVIFGSSPYNIELRKDTVDRVLHIMPKCQDIRRFGSAALDLCHVASGEAGLFFECQVSFWDYAAAELVLTEAGGVMVDFSGTLVLPSPNKTSVIAGSPSNIKASGLVNFKIQ